MTVEGLSHKLTTIELERKYLEEKVREKRESEASVQREDPYSPGEDRRFSPGIYGPGLQDEVKTLVRQREKKLRCCGSWKNN